ncbi:MAG: hypothetical protein ACLUD2_21435 [Clostridium sp.]
MSEKEAFGKARPFMTSFFGNRHLTWQHERQRPWEKEQDGSGEVGLGSKKSLFSLHACCELI